MTLDRIIKQAMRPHRGRALGRAGGQRRRRGVTSLICAFKHTTSLLPFLFLVVPLFIAFSLYSILFWHPSVRPSPSLPSIPSVRIDFVSWQPPACHSIFAFACCSLSLPRSSCLVAATPHLLLLVAYSRFIGFSAADFFSAVARSLNVASQRWGRSELGWGQAVP